MEEKATKVIPIRLRAAQVTELDKLVRISPGASRSSLARDLLQRVITEMTADPSKLLKLGRDGE